MRKRVCERTKTAVDMLDQKKTLTKGEIVMVFKKVTEDLEKQGERMTRLEQKVNSIQETVSKLESRMDTGFNEIKLLIEQNKQRSWIEKIKSLGTKEAFPFWICVLIIILGSFALLGVPLTDWKGIISSMGDLK